MKGQEHCIVFPHWHNKPWRLTLKELNNPLSVLKSFFSDYSLPMLRESFDKWQDRALLTGMPEPLDYIWFREEVEKCLEAAYMLSKRHTGNNSSPPQLMYDFVGMLAHELQGQFAGVVQSLEIIESYRDSSSLQYRAEAGSYFNYLKLAADSALSVLRNMRDTIVFERHTFDIQLNKEVFNVEEVLRSCVSPFNIYKESVSQEVGLVFSNINGVTGNTDIVKFRQIIQNLLHNGIKHADPGTLVKLTASFTTPFLTVKVSNNGKPIPESMREWIFEPYHMIEEGTASTGLGLYICKLYVEALQGRISVNSTGGNTTFEIEVPI